MPGGGKGHGCRASATRNVQNDPCYTNSTGTRDTPNGLTQELEVLGAVVCMVCFGVLLVYAMWKNRRRDSQMVAQALATAAELELAISQTYFGRRLTELEAVGSFSAGTSHHTLLRV